MQMARFHLANIERRPRACCILSGGRFFSARFRAVSGSVSIGGPPGWRRPSRLVCVPHRYRQHLRLLRSQCLHQPVCLFQSHFTRCHIFEKNFQSKRADETKSNFARVPFSSFIFFRRVPGRQFANDKRAGHGNGQETREQAQQLMKGGRIGKKWENRSI